MISSQLLWMITAGKGVALLSASLIGHVNYYRSGRAEPGVHVAVTSGQLISWHDKDKSVL